MLDDSVSNEETELSLLASAILAPDDTIPLTSVSPNEFESKKNSQVWEAILHLYDKGVTGQIDLIVLADHANVTLDYLKTVISTKPTGHKPDYWSGRINKRFRERETYTLLAEGLRSSEDVDTLVPGLINKLSRIGGEKCKYTKTASDVMTSTRLQIESALSGDKVIGIDVGFECVRAAMGGLPTGVVTIIGADTSVGKTALALKMVYNASTLGQQCAFFSLEDSEENIGRRLIAIDSKINLMSLRLGKLTDDEYKQVVISSGKIAKLPLSINDKMYSSADKLCSDIRLEARTKKTRLVVIDYAQIVKLSSHRGTRDSELSEIGIMLKQVAKDLDIAVVLLSQLRRKRDSESERPDKHRLRDSGTLEQHAHVVFLLYREKNKNVTELIIDKTKDGAPGTRFLVFENSCANYRDATMNEIKGTL